MWHAHLARDSRAGCPCTLSIPVASIQFHNDRAGQKRVIEFGQLSRLLSGDQKETSGKGLVKFGRKSRDIADQRGELMRRRVTRQGNHVEASTAHARI